MNTHNHYFDTNGYHSITFLNKFFYNQIKSMLQETGLDITFDDEYYGFTLFGSKFYIFVFYTNANGGTSTQSNLCLPMIFQENDYSIQMNSFYSYFPGFNSSYYDGITGYMPHLSSEILETDITELPEVDEKGFYKWYEKILSVNIDFEIHYNENYITVAYYTHKINSSNGTVTTTKINYFTIAECNICNNKKVLCTSAWPIVPVNFSSLIDHHSLAKDTHTILSPEDNLMRYNNNPYSFLLGGELPIRELTDPEDNTRALLPIPSVYASRDGYTGLYTEYMRNCNILMYFMDGICPSFEHNRHVFNYKGLIQIPESTTVTLLKQATMFNGVVQIPHIYFCDNTFEKGKYYKINNKEYYCIELNTLYEL